VEKQLQDLETRVSEKAELLTELNEVKRLGFDGDSLRQL